MERLSCSSYRRRRVDERYSAAANAMSIEGCGHVNVNDVDTAVLGRFHRCLDRQIQGSRRVIDLGLEGKGRIALNELKQEWRPVTTMSALGAASATSAYRSVRRPPSTLSPPGGTTSSPSAPLISIWHCVGVGGTAVQAASTWERPKSAAPTVRVTNLVLCFSADNCSSETSDVVAPVQATLARRWILFWASSRYG